MSHRLAGRAIPTTTSKSRNGNSHSSEMVQKTMGRLRIRLNRARNLKVGQVRTCRVGGIARPRPTDSGWMDVFVWHSCTTLAPWHTIALQRAPRSWA